MTKKIIQEIIEKAMKYNTIVLTAHKNPDGDAISSSYGLALAFKKAFPKRKILVIGDPDKWESRFTFLKVRKNMFINPNSNIDGKYLAIVGDTSVSNRINGYEIFKNATSTICFDHHSSESDLEFDIFWSEPKYCASSLQAIEIADKLLAKLNQEIAFCLIIGVYTDTNNFRYSFADPKPLRIVAKCLEYVDNRTMDIFFRKLSERSVDHIKLARFVMSKIKYSNDFAYVIFSKKQRAKYPDHINIGKSVGIISNIIGIKKWAFFTEHLKSDGVKYYKGHLRSNGPSLLAIATKYNGGGHHRAVGCTIEKKELKNIISELSI